jgi:hypothetical protein
MLVLSCCVSTSGQSFLLFEDQFETSLQLGSKLLQPPFITNVIILSFMNPPTNPPTEMEAILRQKLIQSKSCTASRLRKEYTLSAYIILLLVFLLFAIIHSSLPHSIMASKFHYVINLTHEAFHPFLDEHDLVLIVFTFPSTYIQKSPNTFYCVRTGKPKPSLMLITKAFHR